MRLGPGANPLRFGVEPGTPNTATERTSAESTDPTQLPVLLFGEMNSSVLENVGCCVTIPTEFVNRQK